MNINNNLLWIVENIVKEPSYINLTNEIKTQGYNLYEINGDYKDSDLNFVGKDTPVISSGSIEICKLIKNKLKFNSPVTYSTFENYLCSKYYPYFEDFLFNDQYILLPLISLNKRFWQFYGLYGRDCNIFIRPNDGDKSFKAGLVDVQDWPSFYNEFEHLKNELILISTPKNIMGEWRFVVTKYKEILAISSYRYQGLSTRIPSAPNKATQLVKDILNIGYYPDSVFCVDVCEDSDGNFWLMELTSFSSAGLYACKMDNLVKSISEIAIEDNKINL